MSVKDNLEAVKKELNTEEQFLESLIKTERVFKKYKYHFIITLLAVVLAFVVYKVDDYLAYQKTLKANQAFVTLQNNPNDSVAKELLKNNNEKLYNIYLIKEQIAADKAIEAKNIDEIQKSLIEYYSASKSESKEKLSSYANSNSVLLKDFTNLQEGFLFLKEGKREVALTKFSQIPMDSPLKSVVNALSHYKITEAKIDENKSSNMTTKKVLNITNLEGK